jgi:hypothetical protein
VFIWAPIAELPLMIVNERMMSIAKVVRFIAIFAPHARPNISDPKLGIRNSALEIVPIIRSIFGMGLRLSVGSSNFRFMIIKLFLSNIVNKITPRRRFRRQFTSKNLGFISVERFFGFS